jgi:hypothetical protein
LLRHLAVCTAVSTSAAALLLSVLLPVIWVGALSSAVTSVICIVVLSWHYGILSVVGIAASLSASSTIVCITAALSAAASLSFSALQRHCLRHMWHHCLRHCPLRCHCCLRHCHLCCWGGGESLFQPVSLWGGRWCDIPMTWQMVARTYSDKQCDTSK